MTDQGHTEHGNTDAGGQGGTGQTHSAGEVASHSVTMTVVGVDEVLGLLRDDRKPKPFLKKINWVAVLTLVVAAFGALITMLTYRANVRDQNLKAFNTFLEPLQSGDSAKQHVAIQALKKLGSAEVAEVAVELFPSKGTRAGAEAAQLRLQRVPLSDPLPPHHQRRDTSQAASDPVPGSDTSLAQPGSNPVNSVPGAPISPR